jgi:hypothetical protein
VTVRSGSVSVNPVEKGIEEGSGMSVGGVVKSPGVSMTVRRVVLRLRFLDWGV